MSAATAPSPDTGSTAVAGKAGGEKRTTPGSAGVGRRLVLWAGVVLVLTALVTILVGRAGSSTRPLDPDNPEGEGMQALAAVLDQQGVQVEIVRGVENLPQEPADGATVLVADTALLSADSGEQLWDYARSAASVVVLSPADNLADTLEVNVEVTDLATTTPMSPECDLALWNAGEEVSRADRRLRVDNGVPRRQVTTCLPPSPGFNAGGAREGYLVEISATQDRPRIVVAGLADALTNEHITADANAATGLRLLGASERLVWVIPTIADAGPAPPVGLFDVLPAPVLPGMAVVVAALVAWSLVRGRRLGRVSTEPLPVVIRAVETTTSRGRLYQEAADRRRALASLQLAARGRLATRLGLPAGTSPERLVRRVCVVTGRPASEVRRLLLDSAVDDDDTLVRTAREVRSLEEGLSQA